MTAVLRRDLVSPRIEERLRSGDLTSAHVEAFRERSSCVSAGYELARNRNRGRS